MSNYHGRIMNLPAKPQYQEQFEKCHEISQQFYRLGHRDARHAAAEIANEADGQLEAAEGMAHLLELLIQSEVIGGPVAKKAKNVLAAWTAAKEGR